MNNYITYTARAKLRNLSNSVSKPIKITCKNGGFSITYLDDIIYEDNVIICHNPKVFTDAFTLNYLKEASVDFSYGSDEFVITKDTNELSTYA